MPLGLFCSIQCVGTCKLSISTIGLHTDALFVPSRRSVCTTKEISGCLRPLSRGVYSLPHDDLHCDWGLAQQPHYQLHGPRFVCDISHHVRVSEGIWHGVYTSVCDTMEGDNHLNDQAYFKLVR